MNEEMDTAQSSFSQRLALLGKPLQDFFSFVGMKLQNFKNLTLGEQISYSSIFAGLAFIITAVILFIV